jgi:hypothetical protein
MLDIMCNSLAVAAGGWEAVRCVRGEEHASLSSFISKRFGGLVNVIGRYILEFLAESL